MKYPAIHNFGFNNRLGEKILPDASVAIAVFLWSEL